MAVLRQIDAVVVEFRALEMEAVFVGQNALHGRHLDLVGDWQMVDVVTDLVILNDERSILGSVQV